MVALVLYLTILVAWLWVEEPRRARELKQARAIFGRHPGIKIAILGSYGKTTMKELLLAVLSSQKTVAATPGNKNVAISHARWAKKLTGKEDVVLIEYGEGGPGDISRLAELSQPDQAIITGLAPNHLDNYKSLADVAEDLLSIKKFVSPKHIYVSGDGSLDNYTTSGLQHYNMDNVLGWRISKVVLGYDSLAFTMSHGKRHIHIKSGLIGRHQVPVLAFVAALADSLGVDVKHIEKAMAQTKPFEHRMQPRSLQGAWIIDDTYNGNIEGIKAGLELLKELPAKRKIYVTPGLVDQGSETKRVHREIGVAIAKANPDKVILMQNSVTDDIHHGLTAGGYAGSVELIDDPLGYYTSLEHRLARGDLIMLQNDWTDNYS
jgi:UDP-N-acetylmuramoyl-tripeptide--D-alanyl-D-alanine ligase